MLIEWSTDDVPSAYRFSEWREACCQHVYALTPERSSREPFNGRILHRTVGALDVADIQCDGHLVQRRVQDIRLAPSDTCYVYLQRTGRAWFRQLDHYSDVEAGDMVIADPNIAFTTGAADRFDFRLWRIPRARLSPMLGRSGEFALITLPREDGACGLIAHWLDGLLQHHAQMSAAAVEQALGHLCALVAHVIGAAPQMQAQGRDARRAAQLLQVQRQIELRAADHTLNPETLATELALSLRGLHQLFEPAEHTFHEYLTLTRLARAVELLHDPALAHLSATEIGFAAGFRETSTFYRRFKTRYGQTPGEMRARALARPDAAERQHASSTIAR